MTDGTTASPQEKRQTNSSSDRLSSAPHPTFELLLEKPIDSLGLVLMEFKHKVTGARHVHLSSDKKENVFLVGLQTLPRDSSGVAHVLEHTVLCGSEKFPVRDPFFMMMRRSLSTFMNAFTSSDWTAYPFATENKQDFQNLLSVYLDAVFFSRIDPLDFSQEGHRLEFATHDDPSTPLEIKGVVYNEMKGAMSPPVSQLYQRLKRHLFQTSTYHFNSGGEPDVIPQLTYNQLLEFYQTHYHPSNAIFCTFGDIPARQHQESFETLCLHRFEKGTQYQTTHELPQFSPVYIEEAFAVEQLSDDQENHCVIGWLIPEPVTSADELALHLLSTLLCGNSASPLRKALEHSDIGSPSPLTGLMSVGPQAMFGAGFQGCDSARKTEIETLIFDTLRSASEEGFDEEDIQAGLFQLEMSQKHISGQNQPYGLELALDVLTAKLYDRPVDDAIDIGPAIEELRLKLEQPDHLTQLVTELLINNQHRVTLLMKPNAEIPLKKAQHQKARLAKYKATLSSAECDALLEKGKALAARQAAEDDPEILPKLKVEDIPQTLTFPEISPQSRPRVNNKPALSIFEAKTNGLVFVQAATSLPNIAEDEITDLRTLHKVWAEVGCGSLDYLQIQKNHFANTGYLTANLNIRTGSNDESKFNCFSVIRANTLDQRFSTMIQQVKDQFISVRFDEIPRLQELLEQSRQRTLQSISGRGHSLALTAANAGYHALASFNMDMSGLSFIQKVKAQGQTTEALAAQTGERLKVLHEKIITQPQHLCLIGGEHSIGQWVKDIDQHWQLSSTTQDHFVDYQLKSKEHQAWLTSAQINFCAMSIPAVGRKNPDAAALDVLSTIMNNGFLHTALREKGGAYGGGAGANTSAMTFDFYSYRDPRINNTFDDFFQSMDWAKKQQFTQRQLDEAILSMISSFDKPGSPSGEASVEFSALIHGRTIDERQAYRQAILNVTLDDLAQVAQTYFNGEQHTKVVVTNKTAFEHEKLSGFTVHEC